MYENDKSLRGGVAEEAERTQTGTHGRIGDHAPSNTHDSGDCHYSPEDGCECDSCDLINNRGAYDMRGWLPLEIAKAREQGITRYEIEQMIDKEYGNDRYTVC